LKRLPYSNAAVAAAGNLLGILERLDGPSTNRQTLENKAKNSFRASVRSTQTQQPPSTWMGLMVFCHDGSTFQAGIHTATEPEHVVTVLVRKKGQKDPILYSNSHINKSRT